MLIITSFLVLVRYCYFLAIYSFLHLNPHGVMESTFRSQSILSPESRREWRLDVQPNLSTARGSDATVRNFNNHLQPMCLTRPCFSCSFRSFLRTFSRTRKNCSKTLVGVESVMRNLRSFKSHYCRNTEAFPEAAKSYLQLRTEKAKRR